MPVPHHDGKHAATALVDPDEAVDPDSADVPSSIVLVFQSSLFERVREERTGPEIEVGHGIYDLHPVADAPDVGVVGNFGIGAPIAALVVEGLAVCGAERFLAAGYAGCLQRSIGMGEPIVATRALRDEGVSHHYLEPGRWVAADEALVARCEAAARAVVGEAHVGPAWTTSAPYRETVPEVERYAEEGVLAVEMEAAAVFAVANFRDLDAGAVFTVSDYLGPEEWDPQFDDAEADLERLFDVAVDALSR